MSSRRSADGSASARWQTDPRAFVDGLSIAFLVNVAIAVVAAAVAALTIASGRSESVQAQGG